MYWLYDGIGQTCTYEKKCFLNVHTTNRGSFVELFVYKLIF